MRKANNLQIRNASRSILQQRLTAAYSKDPQARAAAEALRDAALRLFNATDGSLAADVLRHLAEDLDAMCSRERPAHRAKGATNYSPTLLRDAMEWAEGHVIPAGSKLGRDRLLARTLYQIQGEKPGQYGSCENGIYTRILRLRKEDARALRAATAALGSAEVMASPSLAAFLFKDTSIDDV